MAVKVFFLLCVEAVFAQTTYSQCVGGGFPGSYGLGWEYDGLPYDGMGLTLYDGYGVGAADNFGFSPFGSPYGCGWPASFAGAGYLPSNPGFPNSMYGGEIPSPSGSSIPPARISVLSENFVEGTVSVVGQLPFVASVSMAGEFPSVGSGAVSYGCGDGSIRILGEGLPPSYISSEPAMYPIDYTGLYPYGPAFVDDYRESIPYTGCSFSPFY